MSAPTDSSLENNPKEVQKATPEDYAHARPHTVAVDVFMQARRLFQQAEAANCTRKERVEKPLEFIAQFRVTEKSSLPKKVCFNVRYYRVGKHFLFLVYV